MSHSTISLRHYEFRKPWYPDRQECIFVHFDAQDTYDVSILSVLFAVDDSFRPKPLSPLSHADCIGVSVGQSSVYLWDGQCDWQVQGHQTDYGTQFKNI